MPQQGPYLKYLDHKIEKLENLIHLKIVVWYIIMETYDEIHVDTLQTTSLYLQQEQLLGTICITLIQASEMQDPEMNTSNEHYMEQDDEQQHIHKTDLDETHEIVISQE